MYSFLILIIFILTNLYFGYGISNNFLFSQNCNIVGDNSEHIYNQNHLPYFQVYHYGIKINGLFYVSGYCECDSDTSNCRVEYDAVKNETHHKLIMEYTMLTDLTNFTEDDLIDRYNEVVEKRKKINILANEETDRIIDNLCFSNVIVEYHESSESYSEIYIQDINSPKDFFIVDQNNNNSISETDPKVFYPLYLPNTFDLSLTFIVIGKFDIRNVVECISDDLYFKNKNITKNVYTKDGFQPVNINCSWGNPLAIMEQQNIRGHYPDYNSSRTLFKLNFVTLILSFIIPVVFNLN